MPGRRSRSSRRARSAHRRPARERLGDDEPVRLVPARRDERDRRVTHEPRELGRSDAPRSGRRQPSRGRPPDRSTPRSAIGPASRAAARQAWRPRCRGAPLLRHDAPEPHRRARRPGPAAPAIHVDPVQHHVRIGHTLRHAAAVCALTAAKVTRHPPETWIADSSHGVGGVCSVDTIGTGPRRHRDRQVVEAVVVDDVELVRAVLASRTIRSR